MGRIIGWCIFSVKGVGEKSLRQAAKGYAGALRPGIMQAFYSRVRIAMAVGHYENFPVGSLLLPARIRPAVHAIYRFARYADDLADEGDATPAQRLAAWTG